VRDRCVRGKSLVGRGENIIEPASMGKPLLFGPSMHNFREAAELLLGSGGAIQVGNARSARRRSPLSSATRRRATPWGVGGGVMAGSGGPPGGTWKS
jgi:3-deoxy-D-manno-octulosonic-acid transferase